MKSILLVNPQYELEIRWIADERQIDVKADYFPLGLATVAALTPEGYRADIWDELVRGPVEQAALPRTYDLVGVTSHRSNLDRAFAISDYFRAQGVPVAVGGPGVSGAPDRCRGRFDFLLLGECEHLWPRFLREWAAGCARSEYRQIEKPDLTASPLPKWDSIVGDVPLYAMGTVQTTRGCPYDCEFCDVIYLNGRVQRHKTVEQILDRREPEVGLARGSVRLLAALESPKGLFNAYAIATASPRVIGLLFGAEDFSRELSLPLRREGEARDLIYARSALVTAAACAHVQAVDGVWPDLQDTEGLKTFALQSRRLGFSGMSLIHPAQVDTVNAAFTPAADEIDYARGVLKAFDEARARGEGAVAFGGQLLDLPIVDRARQTLELADSLSTRSS